MRTLIFRDVIDPSSGKVKVLPIVIELERIEDLPAMMVKIDRLYPRDLGGRRNG